MIDDRGATGTHWAWPPARLIAVVGAFALVRAIVAAMAPLVEDETYYRLWTLAPALSFLDHPPMVAWLMGAGRLAIGDNPLGLRFGAILASLIGPLVLWRATWLLFGPGIARMAVIFALAMPLLAVGGVIMTPDVPSVMFWGLAFWALAELQASRNAAWWLAVGMFAGLGLLSKYTNLFLGAAILLWLLAVPENRRWLASWQLWAGGLLAGLLTLPVVIWNAQHGWASFAKQFGRVAHHKALGLSGEAELLGGMALLASPVIFAIAAAGLWIVIRQALRTRDGANVLLVASIVPLLLYFIVHAMHDRVQANWPAPLYPALAIAAAIACARVAWLQGARRLVGTGIALGLLSIALIYLHAVTPLYIRAGLKDPTLQMRGWGVLARDIDRVRQQAGAAWIATSKYTTTGRLAYELKGRVEIVQLTERVRFAHLPPVAAGLLASPAIYLELERRAVPDLLRQRFGSVEALGTLERRHGGILIETYRVYRIAEPKGAVLGP